MINKMVRTAVSALCDFANANIHAKIAIVMTMQAVKVIKTMKTDDMVTEMAMGVGGIFEWMGR